MRPLRVAISTDDLFYLPESFPWPLFMIDHDGEFRYTDRPYNQDERRGYCYLVLENRAELRILDNYLREVSGLAIDVVDWSDPLAEGSLIPLDTWPYQIVPQWDVQCSLNDPRASFPGGGTISLS